MGSRADEYRRLAQECLTIARAVTTEEAKFALIEMARVRARLAEDQDVVRPSSAITNFSPCFSNSSNGNPKKTMRNRSARERSLAPSISACAWAVFLSLTLRPCLAKASSSRAAAALVGPRVRTCCRREWRKPILFGPAGRRTTCASSARRCSADFVCGGRSE